jgi:hypothetical protein
MYQYWSKLICWNCELKCSINLNISSAGASQVIIRTYALSECETYSCVIMVNVVIGNSDIIANCAGGYIANRCSITIKNHV